MNTLIRLAAVATFVGIAFTACLTNPSQYSIDMKGCTADASTCEELVACRKRVAAANGDEFHAVCNDAGADGGAK